MMSPAVMWHIVQQSLFCKGPSITEKNVPDQTDRVHLITGGNTGIGFELSQILYRANATVYLTSRDVTKGQAAIDRIKAAVPASKGRLELLQVDLADLPSIKKCADEFKARESKLHYLCNNAGLMMPPRGMTTAQGHDIEIGTNCLGPYLFTKLLTPLLRETAQSEKEKGVADSVRVSWAGSLVIDAGAPSGGIVWDANGKPKTHWMRIPNYGQSKAGNLFLANIYANEVEGSGIVSVVRILRSISSGDLE
jgi:retinol dehydrogenase 12